MVILCDGRVAMCSPDFDNKYGMGDLKQNSIKEIWNSEGFNSLREKHLKQKRSQIDLCKTCVYWDRKYIWGNN